jgi:dodecin
LFSRLAGVALRLFITSIKEDHMAIVKVIEVLAQSPKSWEDATNIALQEAARSVRNIKSIYVKEFNATVENNRVTEYRINAKISFVVENH